MVQGNLEDGEDGLRLQWGFGISALIFQLYAFSDTTRRLQHFKDIRDCAWQKDVKMREV